MNHKLKRGEYMKDWKKDLVICQYCEHAEEDCKDVQVEMEKNEKKKFLNWKCQGYDRDETK